MSNVTGRCRSIRAGVAVAMLAGAVAVPLAAQCSLVPVLGGTFGGANAEVHAVVQWDPDGAGPQPSQAVIGGEFLFAGSASARHVATLDPVTGQWLPLGNGIAETVRALATLPTGELFAASWDRIQQWNGTSWTTIGTANGEVRALAVASTGHLLAGGGFYVVNGVWTYGVATWNGSTWSACGGGLPWLVATLAVAPNGDVYAGDSHAMGNLARFDGTAWSTFAVTNHTVRTVAVAGNGDVIVAGDFTLIGGAAVGHIARWNGAAWQDLGGQTDWSVDALAIAANGDIFAGGYGTTLGGAALANVARWNGSAWQALGAGTDLWVNDLSLAANGDLLAVGGFQNAGGVTAERFARWDGTQWHATGTSTGIAGPYVNAICQGAAGDLYVGGWFTHVGGVAAANVAVRRNGAWQALGGGVGGVNAQVFALHVLRSGDVIACGQFTTAGGVPANRVARWDGTTWSALGAGVNGIPACALELANGDVIVGGGFTSAGSAAANGVARWDGAAWHALGSGIGGGPIGAVAVNSLATLGTDLYVAGTFTHAGGQPASVVARWDGAAWHGLGGTTGGIGIGLVELDGDLVLTGSFGGTIAGQATGGVARWDGTQWSAFGGTPVYVNSGPFVALPGGGAVLGGNFYGPFAPGNRLLRWDGAAWLPMGTGADNGVSCIVRTHTGEIVMGGSFTTLGGAVAPHLGSWQSTCPASVTAFGGGCTGAGGPNELVATQYPWLGGVFAARASGLAAQSLGVAVYGLSTASVPLASILPQGLSGCTLHVAPDLLGLAPVAAGVAETVLPIPIAAGLIGASLHHQVVALELGPGLALTALSSTGALTGTIGAY